MPRARPVNAGEQAALLVAALGLLGVSTALASASAGPPAPRIDSHPPRQTRARTATFYFSDAQPRVSFRCSLDGSRPIPCSSPVRYGRRLAPGQHTFSVLARSAGGEYSAPTSYRYMINLKAPRVEVSFPARGGIYNAAGWTNGCPGGGGACGSVVASSGVRGVTAWLKRAGTSAAIAASPDWQTARLTRAGHHRHAATRAKWFYRLSLPRPDGSYTLVIRATDRIGNVTRRRTERVIHFTIDNTPPPAPQLVSTPSLNSTTPSAAFSFTDTAGAVSFQCSIDDGAWASCTSPVSYPPVSAGEHVFGVRAVDPAGNVSQASSWSWTYAPVSSAPFTVTGNATEALYPGAQPSQIPLSLLNPNAVAITVTAVTVTLDSTSLPPGCDPSAYEIDQPSLTSAGVQIPGDGSVTLPAQGASTAAIRMLDLGSNQDACQSAHLRLLFSGTAQ